jgi:hypothetical protein
MTAGERQARCCGRLHGGGRAATGSAGTSRHFLTRFGLGENFAFLATGRLATVRGRLATVRRSLTVRRRLATGRGGLPTRRRFATGRGGLPTRRRRLAARRGLPTRRRRLAARRGLPTRRRRFTARRGLFPTRRRLPTGGLVPARRRLPTGRRCLPAWWWLIPATRRRFAAGGLLFLAGLLLVGSFRRGRPATLRWWSPFRAMPARATVVGPRGIPVVPSTASVVGPGITVVRPGVALAGPRASVVRARVAMRRVAATGKCVAGAHQGEPERAGKDGQPQGCPPRASGTRLGKVHTFSLRGLHRRLRRRRPNPPGLTPRTWMSETAMPDVLPR